MSEWLTCGERYRLHRIEHAPELPATWFFSGTAFHKAAEEWELCGRDMLISEAQQIYEETFLAELARADQKFPRERWLYGGRSGVQKDIDSRLVAGKGWVAAYCEYALEDDWQIWELPDGSPAVEVPLTIHVPYGDDGKTIKVVGFIDQILFNARNGRLRIRDLKTSTKEPIGRRQLGFYAHGVRATYGETVTEGDYFMAKKGRPTFPTDLSGYTREDFDREVRRLETALENEIYIPNPGDHCRPCGVKYSCAVFTQ